MSLATNITNAFTRVATEFKTLRTLIGGSATSDISALTTTDKSSLVGAINEVKAGATGSPPAATTTQAGVVELATNAEAVTGTDAVRAVTPSGVASAIAGKADTASLSAVATSGDAGDLTGTLPSAVLPPLAVNETFTPLDQTAMLALNAQRGDVAIRQDTGQTFILSTDSPATLADWKEITASGAVQSVAGKTGVVTLTKADVGLGNVDNTSDLNKPISTATQTALDLKANATDVYSQAQIGDVNTDFAAGFVAALA
jgi:hypothetical protein